MKGSHEPKRPRMKDILTLPLQDPPCEEFSSIHINWVKVGGGKQGGDDMALIPFSRVDDFVKGESVNAECPASFRIESRRRRCEGSVHRPRVDGYLEYTLYWCSYGPEDYRDCENGICERSDVKPRSGKGSRPGRRPMMRGCLCHFTVKRLYRRPCVALVIYNQRNHVDKTGAPCHGLLDRHAVGTRAMYAPRISEELRQKVTSLLFAGISVDDIMQYHVEIAQSHIGPQKRDNFLTRNDVRNMERVVRNASYELHQDDLCSVKMWLQRQEKHAFFFASDPESEFFVLGIQTDFQLQQIIRHGHNRVVACHSTFGVKKLKYPLCSLLVFDSSNNAIPVAWVVSFSPGSHYIQHCLAALVQRIRNNDPQWHPDAFLVDNPSFEVAFVRDVFHCRVMLSLWHIRRTFLKKLLKKCSSFNVVMQIIKHLGRVLHTTTNGSAAMLFVEEFMQVFVDQRSFLDYFRDRWLPEIELWINSTRIVPIASLESSSALESYHLMLKSKLFDNQHAKSWGRVDWLVHVLTTEFHSLFWFNRYTTETGYLQNLRGKSSSDNSWNQALLIPDTDVILDVEHRQHAKVISQTNKDLVYTVWNSGSEFSVCDCSWSRKGNLCKHVVKVAIVRKSEHAAQPLLPSRVDRRALFTLLQSPANEPPVHEQAVLYAGRMQQDMKELEDLSDWGIIQPLQPENRCQMADNGMTLPH